jgi:Domain of unknown function (DUF4346)
MHLTTPCTPPPPHCYTPCHRRTVILRQQRCPTWRLAACSTAKADTVACSLEASTPAAVAAAVALDDALSRRHLTLDPAGYFLVSARHSEGVVVAEHYSNVINTAGLACDPRTGEVIPCSGYSPPPPRVFTGATAKEVAVAVFESDAGVGCVTRLEHAAYLGRELQKAEHALRTGTPYVQD